jgi:hypothetical protein
MISCDVVVDINRECRGLLSWAVNEEENTCSVLLIAPPLVVIVTEAEDGVKADIGDVHAKMHKVDMVTCDIFIVTYYCCCFKRC